MLRMDKAAYRRVKNGGITTNSRLKALNVAVSRAARPTVLIRSAIGNPKPSKDSRVWVSKRVQVWYTTIPSGVVQCKLSDLVSASVQSQVSNTTPFSGLYGSTTPFKVLGVRVWNMSLGFPVKADLDADVLTVGSSTQSMVASDVGTGTQLAGVRFIIPEVITQTLFTAGSETLVTVSMPGGITATTLSQFRFCVEYTLLVQT